MKLKKYYGWMGAKSAGKRLTKPTPGNPYANLKCEAVRSAGYYLLRVGEGYLYEDGTIRSLPKLEKAA